MSNVTVITVDGPSGTGKGKICSRLAYFLKWNFLDSGALYRVLAIAAERNQIKSEDELVQLIDKLDPILKSYIKENNVSLVGDKRFILGGTENDITKAIVEKLNKDFPTLN